MQNGNDILDRLKDKIKYFRMSEKNIKPIELIFIHNDFCTVAFVIQFTFLAAFFWLNVMCADIAWTFRSVKNGHFHDIPKVRHHLRLRNPSRFTFQWIPIALIYEHDRT